MKKDQSCFSQSSIPFANKITVTETEDQDLEFNVSCRFLEEFKTFLASRGVSFPTPHILIESQGKVLPNVYAIVVSLTMQVGIALVRDFLTGINVDWFEPTDVNSPEYFEAVVPATRS